MDNFEAQQNDRMRTEAHNKVIDQLNYLNGLAEKYGVRRFTCRNFLTSRNYNSRLDEYGVYGNRLKTDRKMVEGYFTVAYKQRVEAIKNRLSGWWAK